jgi:hypothetical protein
MSSGEAQVHTLAASQLPLACLGRVTGIMARITILDL